MWTPPLQGPGGGGRGLPVPWRPCGSHLPAVLAAGAPEHGRPGRRDTPARRPPSRRPAPCHSHGSNYGWPLPAGPSRSAGQGVCAQRSLPAPRTLGPHPRPPLLPVDTPDTGWSPGDGPRSPASSESQSWAGLHPGPLLWVRGDPWSLTGCEVQHGLWEDDALSGHQGPPDTQGSPGPLIPVRDPALCPSGLPNRGSPQEPNAPPPARLPGAPALPREEPGRVQMPGLLALTLAVSFL